MVLVGKCDGEMCDGGRGGGQLCDDSERGPGEQSDVMKEGVLELW